MHAAVPWMPEVPPVAMITVRGLDPVVHAKLRERAARHGRSMEAEARAVLTEAVEHEKEPTDLIAVFRRHFSDLPFEVALELPPRDMQRPIEFD